MTKHTITLGPKDTIDITLANGTVIKVRAFGKDTIGLNNGTSAYKTDRAMMVAPVNTHAVNIVSIAQ